MVNDHMDHKEHENNLLRRPESSRAGGNIAPAATVTESAYKTSGVTLSLDEALTTEKTAQERLAGYRDIRIGVATPQIRLGDVAYNEQAILDLISQASLEGADALLFSDMALTGRSVGDLLFQRSLQDACLESLARITKATATSHLLVLLSLPLRLE
ncbi:MAG TPA: hypothetical protein VFD19_02200, partial [Clostridia bacterium]|nr:hypothetical protein [Clostridia bacterium]